MGRVVIIDTRPDWVIQEDAEYKCMFRCRMRRGCVSKFGAECKVQGGSKIPKIRTR